MDKLIFFSPENVVNYSVYVCVLYLYAVCVYMPVCVCSSSQASASSHMFQLFASPMQKTAYFAFHECGKLILSHTFCKVAFVERDIAFKFFFLLRW